MGLWQLHLAAVGVSGGLSIAVTYWIYTSGRGRAATAFAALLAVMSGMVLLLGLQLLVPDLRVAVFLFYLRQAVGYAVGPLWLVFALLYTGREEYLTPTTVGLLIGGYLLFVGLTLTNPLHGLAFRDVYLRTEPFEFIARRPGPVYWIGLTTSYAVALVGIGMIGKVFLNARRVSRAQTTLLLAAGAAVISISVAENAGVLLVEGFEYTVLGSGFVGAFVGIAIYSHRLFDVQPLARDMIVENLESPVIVVDDRLRVIDFNDAATDTFGLDGTGTDIETLVPDLVADRGATGEARFADSITLADGERRTLLVSCTTLEVGPDTRGYALVCKDVTELETYARKLEQQTDQLERVANAISHDLRNPLSVARGALELAREGDEDELDRVEDSLDRMSEIIDDALTLAREGQAIGERQRVSLSTVAQRAWTTTRTGDATLELDTEDVYVLADEGRLRTVFENLFRNSVEHGSTGSRTEPGDSVEHGSTGSRTGSDDSGTDTDGGTLTVRVGRVEDGFYVADDGPGIPEAERDRLFEVGFTTAEDGTGLGLAIVDSIATAHGWEVAVTDSDAGGAKFVFRGVELAKDVETTSGGVTDD